MTSKTHPDDMAEMIRTLAEAHGYGVTNLELVGRKPIGSSVAVHRYDATYVMRQNMDGTGSVEIVSK